ncbi:glycine cleavage system aminomethyltransferase GcvT [Subtercola endophyticus]|nr:glycine cleavage system aminomethyltransferase GcvT [Subtercola endophyticus]UFS61048.1 glycine cleavage system aminomethyltransferase GcvT [Subtercola endophyticus]
MHDTHVAAGALFTDFAGWQMPVRYTSDLAEHHAVRMAAGLFDLSHMAELAVRGPQAAEFLDYALAGKLSATAVGQAKYSMLLAESGGIIDDVVVYRLADDDFLVVANAGNHEVAYNTLLERAAAFDVTVADESDGVALIAVQGPRALEILMNTAGLVTPDARDLAALKYYWSQPATYAGEDLLVARTGYTGEDGFELYTPVALATQLWADLMAAGEPFGLVPAGLAARDTLRLEAGMPLYGHELGLDTLPAQAGLGRVPNLSKGDFVGRAALERASSNPTSAHERVLVGLLGDGKRAARAGYELFAADAASADANGADAAGAETGARAQPIGVVTSGVLSPTLGLPVAMAYIDPRYSTADTLVWVDVRGKRLPFRITPLPFYSRKRD